MTFQNKDMGGFRELRSDEIQAVAGGLIVVTANTYTPPPIGAGLGSFAATLSSIGNAVAGIRNNAAVQNDPLSIAASYYYLADQLTTEEEFDALAIEIKDQPFLNDEVKLAILNEHVPANVPHYFKDDNGNFVNEIVVTGGDITAQLNQGDYSAYAFTGSYDLTYLTPVQQTALFDLGLSPALNAALWLANAEPFATVTLPTPSPVNPTGSVNLANGNVYGGFSFGAGQTALLGIAEDADNYLSGGSFSGNYIAGAGYAPESGSYAAIVGTTGASYSENIFLFQIQTGDPIASFVPYQSTPITLPGYGPGAGGTYYDISGTGQITPPTYDYNNIGGSFFDTP